MISTVFPGFTSNFQYCSMSAAFLFLALFTSETPTHIVSPHAIRIAEIVHKIIFFFFDIHLSFHHSA